MSDQTRLAEQTIGARSTLWAATVAPPSSALPTASAPANPGFELGKTIGTGGMGVIRTAQQLSLRRTVAVKTLRADRLNAVNRAALLHEALVTGLLQHPNIVPIYTVFDASDASPAIAMKQVEGISWSECLEAPERAPNFNPADPVGWHLGVMAQVCQAVHFAHSHGIIHRDIKPQNVMLGAFGEVYLVDWGMAVTTDDAKSEFLVHVRSVNGLAGTPAYMAPEMAALAGGSIDPRLQGAMKGLFVGGVE